jgi:DNA-binding NarL/FixJ family response regulator
MTVPLTVVCVDDDPDMVELLRISVAGEPDFELVASTGEAMEVLDLLRKHHPDVVILDHRLTGSAAVDEDGARFRRAAMIPTGLELVEGARVALPDATIVIFTGQTGLHRAALNVGADACVEKPALSDVWPVVREVRALA